VLDSTTARLAAVLLLAALLQYAVFSTIRVLGVAPDLMLVVAIAAGLVAGAERGAVTGFAAGVAMDLMMPGRPFGLSVLTLTLVGYLVGRYQVTTTNTSNGAAVLNAGLASVLAAGCYISLARVTAGIDLLGGRFVILALGAALWSMVLVIPVIALMKWTWRQPTGVSAWSR
jgi:rod shape-determining protein MreD